MFGVGQGLLVGERVRMTGCGSKQVGEVHEGLRRMDREWERWLGGSFRESVVGLCAVFSLSDELRRALMIVSNSAIRTERYPSNFAIRGLFRSYPDLG